MQTTQETYRISSYFDGSRFCKGDFRLQVINGKIADLSAWPHETAPAQYSDLRNYTLVPPLSDAHIHAALVPWPLAPEERKGYVEADPFAAGLARVVEAPLSGVGLLRDGGDPRGVNLFVRSALHKLGCQGQATPDYLVPGPALYSPGRYGSFLGEAMADREAMRQMIASLQQRQVDFVKILPTGIINFKTGLATAPPQFTTADLQYFVDLCHGSGWKVMAHASGSSGVRQAVDCGVDYIEHGYFVEPATLEAMAAGGIAWTPTFSPVWVQMQHHAVCGWDTEVRERLAGILEGHRCALDTARRLGIRILTGSDAGAPGVDQVGGIHLELGIMQQAGIPVEELLHWSCWATPAQLGRQPASWEPGSPARFIVAPHSVMHDVTALQAATSVVWDGTTHPFMQPRVHPVEAAQLAG